ncbi:hypothetical protein BC939DRAFT_28722 [Gamsiella multidivaricata]|uniref:uncharacterized protein n=1 Tax=Gamsiella multidivaricata TaxID=101098 RepID=UPI002220B0D5|nr:uncharacterized protein BC939DRAFT_28722 [Gamsiella multidivaricata]KAI7816869.1 hypothetical protein BC939DRAFT_28722 [Gamsiella multidivaricata]
MRIFDKFFGVVAPATGAPILAGLYAIVGLVFAILCFGRCKCHPSSIQHSASQPTPLHTRTRLNNNIHFTFSSEHGTECEIAYKIITPCPHTHPSTPLHPTLLCRITFAEHRPCSLLPPLPPFTCRNGFSKDSFFKRRSQRTRESRSQEPKGKYPISLFIVITGDSTFLF